MRRRHEVTDSQWKKIAPLLPGKAGDPGRTAEDNRIFINAIFWLAKTGAPWRDLPERFGNWNSVFRRFRRWSDNGIWLKIMEALGDEDAEGFEELMLDSSVVRAHQHAAGAEKKTGEMDQALGRSRGGFSTKIHAAVSGDGQAVRLVLTGGQRHDITEAEHLVDGLHPKSVIADKGYDSDELRKTIRAQGSRPVIPGRKGHRSVSYSKTAYKHRNIVERFFNKIKHFRRVSTRYDKLEVSYYGWLCFASTLAGLK